MIESTTPTQEFQRDNSPFVIARITTPAVGINYPSWKLHSGLLIGSRLAMRFVAAPQTVKLGFFQLQNGELINREKVADFAYSKNYELVYPDGWKIELRCFMGVGGLFVCVDAFEGKRVRLAKEAGITLPEPWETKRY